MVSHQDDDSTIDITTLSTGSQLNIQADVFATKGLQQLHANPKVPLDPLTEVIIHQQEQTIIRDIKKSMLINIQLLIMEEDYQRRFC